METTFTMYAAHRTTYGGTTNNEATLAAGSMVPTGDGAGMAP